MRVSSKLQISLVAGILIALGLGLTLYKKIELGFPLLPGQRQAVWTLESKISFKPVGGPVEISLALPEPEAGWVVLDEHFASSGFGFSTQEEQGERYAQWNRESLNRTTTLYYKLEIYHAGQFDLGASPIPEITPPELTPDRLAAMERVVASLRQKASDPTSFTTLLLLQLVQGQMDQDTAFLFGDREESRLSVVMDVLAFAGIPAQPIKGVFLEDGRRRQQMDTLVEIYDGNHWQVFD